jgi:hypothetical protein
MNTAQAIATESRTTPVILKAHVVVGSIRVASSDHQPIETGCLEALDILIRQPNLRKD